MVQCVNVAAAASRCAEDESGGLEESERERKSSSQVKGQRQDLCVRLASIVSVVGR